MVGIRSRKKLFIALACVCGIFLFLNLKFNVNSPNYRDEKVILYPLLQKVKRIQHAINENNKNIQLLSNSINKINKLKSDPKNYAEIKKIISNVIARTNHTYRVNMGRHRDQHQQSDSDAMTRLHLPIPNSVCAAIGSAPNQTREARPDIDMQSMYARMDFTDVDGGAWKQGFPIKAAHQKWTSTHPLLVFVLPHSHQDPGWIKTVDEYFESQTKPILDSMLAFLTVHPDMTFVYAEMSFFQMWWDTLAGPQRDAVIRLLRRGQLEIATGGWVMNDEADTHYAAISHQLMEGQQWLFRHAKYQPMSNWAIDPFGHSQTMAYFVKNLGMEQMVIQRVHYIVKKYLARDANLEFNWRQHWDASGRHQVLTHMFPFYSYDIPHTCGPNPSVCCQFDYNRLRRGNCPWGIPPVEITDENVEERARTLLNQYQEKATLYRENGGVLFVPLGDDFRYETREEWDIQYRNYAKLMAYMNGRADWHVRIQFGTLHTYFDALRKRKHEQQQRHDQERQKHQPFPVLSGDMFTYTDRNDHYWSGYYTSRAFYKRLDRVVESRVRAAELLHTLALLHHKKLAAEASSSSSSDSSLFGSVLDITHIKLRSARRQLALFQHHDGVTGTAKSHVVRDYARRLVDAWGDAGAIIRKCAAFLLSPTATQLRSTQEAAAAAPPQHQPDKQNARQQQKQRKQQQYDVFDVDELRVDSSRLAAPKFITFDRPGQSRFVYLFNSLAQPRQTIIRLPVNLAVSHPTHSSLSSFYQTVRVIGVDKNAIRPAQLSPYIPLHPDAAVNTETDTNTKQSGESPLHLVEFALDMDALSFERVELVPVLPAASGSATQTPDGAAEHVEIYLYNGHAKLPRLSANYLQIVHAKSDKSQPNQPDNNIEMDERHITLKSNQLRVRLDRKTGLLDAVQYARNASSSSASKARLTEVRMQLSYETYGARQDKEMSGAYLFLPDGAAKPLPIGSAGFVLVSGPVTSRVLIGCGIQQEGAASEERSTLLSHAMQLNHVDGPFGLALDVESWLDLSRSSQDNNVEVALRLDTGITEQQQDKEQKKQQDKEQKKQQEQWASSFHSDLNCLQWAHRFFWRKLPLQANVYPMTCAAFITGQSERVSVLADQAGGVLSQSHGSLEIFLDRRLGQDDNLGVGQPVLDNRPIVSRHRIVLEPIQPLPKHTQTQSGQGEQRQRRLGQLTLIGSSLLYDLHHPVVLLPLIGGSAGSNGQSTAAAAASQSKNRLLPRRSLLTGSGLPCPIHLVSLKTFPTGGVRDEAGFENPQITSSKFSVLMTLHHLSLRCAAHYFPINTATSSSPISCRVLPDNWLLHKSQFDDLVIKSSAHRTLSGLKWPESSTNSYSSSNKAELFEFKSDPTTSNPHISLQPYEIKTFELKF